MKRIHSWLLAAVFATLMPATTFAKSKVHALLVFDTNDPILGVHARHSRDDMVRVLGSAFRGSRGRRLKWTLLDGNNVTADNILNYYANLKPKKNDTVFFYYA